MNFSGFTYTTMANKSSISTAQVSHNVHNNRLSHNQNRWIRIWLYYLTSVEADYANRSAFQHALLLTSKELFREKLRTEKIACYVQDPHMLIVTGYFWVRMESMS